MQESLSQYSPGQLYRYKAMSIAFALITASIGAAALLGWIIGNDVLKRIHPTLVTMKANTSVCLILISCSFLLLRDPKAANWKRRLGQVCAALVGLIGVLTLSEHVVGWDLHIDQLLFEESVAEAGLSFPGRMGVAASLNFFLLGLALFTLSARQQRWFRVSIISVLTVVAITVLVFLYYFYGIEIEDTVALRFTIALHTVVAFLSLCGAILLARPERGIVAIILGNTPGGMVARRLWPILLIVVLLGSFRTIGAKPRSGEWATVPVGLEPVSPTRCLFSAYF